MNNGDRIIVKSNHTNTIEFHRGLTHRSYTIKPTLAHAERLYNMTEDWPAHSGFDDDGSYWTEYHVSDRALPEPEPAPEVEPDEEFWAPPLDPDPLDSYRDYLETMADEVAATRR